MLRIGVLKKEYYCEKRNVTDRVNMHEKRAEYVIIKGYDLRACARGCARQDAEEAAHEGRFAAALQPPSRLLSSHCVAERGCHSHLQRRLRDEKAVDGDVRGRIPSGAARAEFTRTAGVDAALLPADGAPSCKRLLAFSNWAADCTREWMRRNNCQQYDEINSKIEVLYPPQPVQLTADEVMAKFQNVNKELRFFFVGRDFYRKGMYECLLALKKLREAYPVHLTIVSGLSRSMPTVCRVHCAGGAEVQGSPRQFCW